VEFQAETAFCDGNHNSFHLPSRNQPSIILTAKVKKPPFVLITDRSVFSALSSAPFMDYSMFDTWRFVPITDISVLLTPRPALLTDASVLNT
jgi:hypothetical protein